jgi:quercetin dioxygenase-like cupin family protein
MSLPTGKPFRMGEAQGIKYVFEKKGDILPIHTHRSGDQHFTIVVRGKIRISDGTNEVICYSGDMVNFPVGKAHGFEALEDNSLVINVRN